MLLDRHRPHGFREQRVAPAQATEAVRDILAAAKRRMGRKAGLQAYAVHLAHDLTRVITVEAWTSEADYRRDPDVGLPGSALYAWAATSGVARTPVEDGQAGVIVIDLFRVWRPLLRPITAITVRNGEAFDREPGCVGATVLRGLTAGTIATYARWRSVEAFAAAFSTLTGQPTRTAGDVNEAAARMTFGLIRPDYHSYDLVAADGDVR